MSRNVANKSYSLIIVAALLLMLFQTIPFTIKNYISAETFIALHNIIQFIFIAIAASIFIHGWKGFIVKKESYYFMFALIFMSVAFFQFIYMMSVDFMPVFFNENTPQKSAAMWLIARLIESIGIFFILLYGNKEIKNVKPNLILIITVLVVFVIAFFSIFYVNLLPDFYIVNNKSSLFRYVLESFICVMYGLTILLLIKKIRIEKQSKINRGFLIAVSFLLLSELLFLFEPGARYEENLWGHIYKGIGYLYLMNAFYQITLISPFRFASHMERRSIINQELISSYIQTTSDAFLMLDEKGIIRYINPGYEKLYGYTTKDVIGKSYLTLPTSHQEDTVYIFNTVKNGLDIVAYETRRQTKSGNIIDISLTMTGIKDKKGNVISISGISRDITDIKRTDEILRKSEKLSVIGELAAGIAHEIRNPLTSIKGFVQLIEENVDPSIKTYTKLTLDEIERINTITNDFMIVAKPQVTKYEYNELKQIIENVISFLTPLSNFHNIIIDQSIEENLPNVYSEKNQLKQVLINIIKNSIEAMPKGGNVLVELNG